jgi:hypothetical protein
MHAPTALNEEAIEEVTVTGIKSQKWREPRIDDFLSNNCILHCVI